MMPNKSGAICICVDFRRPNESVLRPLPKVDNTLAQLTGATVFNTNSGFLQIPLEPSSRKFTTFITPFGRYHFNCLPFGIASVPFSAVPVTILSGQEAALCHIDDVWERSGRT